TFGRLSGSPPTRPQSASPTTLAGGRRDDIRRSEQQAYLGLGWRTAATNEPDVYAVDLLTYILGDSPSSRLSQRLRDQDRLVFAIEAAYGAWERAGLTTVVARLDPANLARAEATILEVIQRVKAEGVTEGERQRVIMTAEGNYAFDIETAAGLAQTSGQAGISNFVHAVMVKGTARRSGADLAEAVAGLGGKLIASGEVDYSGIQASALARFWRELLGLTAEVALTPKLEPADVDGERDWLLSRIQR